MATPVDIAPDNDRELVLARLMDATPEALYRCWTETELLPKWFAPRPLTTEILENDLRTGGVQTLVMRGQNGEEYPSTGVYLELVPGRKLVTTDAFVGDWVPAEGGGMMTAVLTFEPRADGKTLYVVRVRHPTAEKKAEHEKMGFHEGWGICAEQLEEVARALR